ncbi:NTP transferase domain-containing protein [Cellulomonas sp. PhB150]|uniref:NTP transferase domain-containing protein n=1 Tax=Cellulomonas sp. PhB150 TaxID=2485188 RepID=UPI000F98986F|nr:NTP transferase domain-containing protein [Cellulomonas sp. PhB150]ROS26168.1 molybdopterin-guanine dinucleotide biosynthesis protein A [Cellulomonas sp. PhB150]
MSAPFDAVVLAGGGATRLGGVVKADVEVGGRALLDHVLAGLASASAVVVVGPPAVARPGVARVLEDPPGGGPVAGLAAGLAHLDGSAPLVVVLACDIPRGAAAIPVLLSAVAESDGARLVADGRPQHLVAVYRRDALDAALARLGDPTGASMRALVAGLDLVDVPDPDDLGADADTWSDVRRLDASLRGTIEPPDGPSTRRSTTMSQDPRRAPGADLPQWVDRLTTEIGVDRSLVDVDRILELASDVAHQVARPAVPVTLFVAGLASAGGSPEDVERILRIVEQHAQQWASGLDGSA